MRPVDAHCHIDFKDFDNDREEVLEECKNELDFIINSGRDPESNKESLELQREYPDFVYATAGIHPTHTESFDQVEKVKTQIREEDFHAVGEIGMDFHHVEDEELREKQRNIFIELVELAEEQDLPVVVHSRNAEKQVIDILSERDVDAYLHCFNGNEEQLKRALNNDMLIGVTYQVEYSTRVENLVQQTSIENILLETDSPFLYKGERNNPLTVKHIADRIASIKGMNNAEVEQETTGNAKQLFRL